MCTVTYIPFNKNSFVLTSNRDESPLRQAEVLFFEEERKLIYPKEPNFGGSWICISANDRVACLLNGAYEKHSHQPPYKKSRGLMLLEIFDYSCFDNFVDDFDFVGMEPFTIVFYEKGNLFEFRWDGTFTHKSRLSADKAYIWSSSTLYTQEMRRKRETWFEDFLNLRKDIDSSSVLGFHENAGEGNSEFDLIMNRSNGKVCTISISQIFKTEDNIQFLYKNRTDNTNLLSNISII